MRSSCLVWYGAWSFVQLTSPEARAGLFCKGLVAAQSISFDQKVITPLRLPLVWPNCKIGHAMIQT